MLSTGSYNRPWLEFWMESMQLLPRKLPGMFLHLSMCLSHQQKRPCNGLVRSCRSRRDFYCMKKVISQRSTAMADRKVGHEESGRHRMKNIPNMVPQVKTPGCHVARLETRYVRCSNFAFG
jgi:hypothetical protein